MPILVILLLCFSLVFASSHSLWQTEKQQSVQLDYDRAEKAAWDSIACLQQLGAGQEECSQVRRNEALQLTLQDQPISPGLTEWQLAVRYHWASLKWLVGVENQYDAEGKLQLVRVKYVIKGAA